MINGDLPGMLYLIANLNNGYREVKKELLLLLDIKNILNGNN
jgi:hypothetical protein